MDELSNKYTYDAKYQEERNTPIKTLMELHLQNNVISYTLKYILSIDEKTNKAKKYDVKIKKSENWNMSKSISLQYFLSAYHCLPHCHMVNKMAMNGKEEFFLSSSSWICVKSWIKT